MPVPLVRPLAKYARFRKATNQYQKVRIVWYVCGKVLLLPFECLCARLLSPFQSVHHGCASQDGLFRLCEAENPCLLSLQEELHGNRTMFGGRRIVSYQSRHSEVPSSLQGDWQYFLQTRNGSGIQSYCKNT